jgi:oligopeptide transport system substrate-binding protein
MKKILSLLLSTILVLTAFAGCAKSDTNEKSSHINAIISSEPSTLDEARFLGIVDRTILFSLTEPLTRIVDGVVTNAGAQDVKISDDGLTYTFTIRENYWSDGQKVTADDYLTGLKREADPTNAFTFASDFFSIENFEAIYNGEKDIDELGVKAIDESTLEIKLSSTNPALLSSVDFFPCREDMVEQYGDSYGSEAESMLSCGPFILNSWVHNSSLDFSKNDKYWDKDNVKLDSFTYSIIADESAQMASLENGSVDYATVSSAEYSQKFSQRSDMNELDISTGRTAMIVFNCEDEIFSNTKIRQAFALCVDRDTLVEVITGGIGKAAYGLVPEDCYVGNINFRNSSELPSKNLASTYSDAKSLLIEGLNELGLSSDPSDLKVKLAFGDTTANGRTYAELYQQMWQNALGVTVEIDFNETATHLSNVNSGDYQIACVSWGSTVEPSFQLSRWATPQGGQSRWINDEYVNLVSSAMENMDESKRLELYQQAEDLIISEAAIVPTYYTANKTFAYNYVGGIPTGAFDTTGMKTLYVTEQ